MTFSATLRVSVTVALSLFFVATAILSVIVIVMTHTFFGVINSVWILVPTVLGICTGVLGTFFLPLSFSKTERWIKVFVALGIIALSAVTVGLMANYSAEAVTDIVDDLRDLNNTSPELLSLETKLGCCSVDHYEERVDHQYGCSHKTDMVRNGTVVPTCTDTQLHDIATLLPPHCCSETCALNTVLDGCTKEVEHATMVITVVGYVTGSCVIVLTAFRIHIMYQK